MNKSSIPAGNYKRHAALSFLKLIESFRKSRLSIVRASYSGSRADPLVKRKSLEKTYGPESKLNSLKKSPRTRTEGK